MPRSWDEKLFPEQKAFLVQKLVEGSLPLEAIIESFQENFTSFKHGIGIEELRLFAEENVPNFHEKIVEISPEEYSPEELEKKIQREIDEGPEDIIVHGETEKINALKKHRRILLELWNNYKKIQIDKKLEGYKQKYLEDISKELDRIYDLEQEEKNLTTMLEEIKKAEETETAEQTVDYVAGYVLPLVVRKCGEDKERASLQLAEIKKKVDLMEKTLKEFPDAEEVVKGYLTALYAKV